MFLNRKKKKTWNLFESIHRISLKINWLPLCHAWLKVITVLHENTIYREMWKPDVRFFNVSYLYKVEINKIMYYFF